MARLTSEKTSKANVSGEKPLTNAELGLEMEKPLTNAELGLEPEPTLEMEKPIDASVDKAKNALLNAAAASAVKAAAEAHSEMSIKEAEKTYVIEKKRNMLNHCKSDDVVEFVGQKIFANYFGKVYTFTYNLIPVTVRFDGSKQYFPRFIYNRIVEKISEVSESNTNKEEIEYL